MQRAGTLRYRAPARCSTVPLGDKCSNPGKPFQANRGPNDDDLIQLGRLVVSNLTTIEVKAFVPARDFALSKQFYQDLGFELAWSDDDLAYMRHGNSSFLLQNFYNEVHAGNFMMHL